MSNQPPPSSKPPMRIVIVANKNWEADPLCAVLLGERARPANLTAFEAPGYPRLDPRNMGPRLRFKCSVANVEVWCVQDLMDPKVSGSNSAEKGRVLPAVFKGDPVSLVVAFGTAGYRTLLSRSMKSCSVYCVDSETSAYLEAHVVRP